MPISFSEVPRDVGTQGGQSGVKPSSSLESGLVLVLLFSNVTLDPLHVRGDRNATDARSKVDQGPIGGPEAVDLDPERTATFGGEVPPGVVDKGDS